MRIRSVKPEFWVSRSIAPLTRDERLLFIGIWNYCDDEGRGVDDARLIKAALFPLDDEVTAKTVERWLHGLAHAGRIRRYTVGGLSYFVVENFKEHQSPNRPTKSKLPPPPDRDSLLSHVQHSETSPPERRGEEKEKERRGSNVPATADAVVSDLEVDFDEAWRAYPRRPGDSRSKARKAYLARRRAGVTAEELLTGVQAYAAYIQRERTKPQYVKGASVFFGPDEHWLADWSPPAARKSPGEDVFERAIRISESAA